MSANARSMNPNHIRKATPEELTPHIFEVFAKFINQRPDLEKENYYNPEDLTRGRRETYYQGLRAYHAELKRISKDGTRARKLLKAAVAMPFDSAAMFEATHAFSGRLEILVKGVSFALAYTAGQYYPTEYRPAAAAVLDAYIRAVTPKIPPSPSDQFYSIHDLAVANERAGQFWFDKGNKRFFSSRVLPELYKSSRLIWFVSSERSGFDHSSPRAFTVRVFDTKDAKVNTAGDGFNAYATAGEAKRAARELLKADKEGKHVQPARMGDQCKFCGSYRHYCSGTPSQEVK